MHPWRWKGSPALGAIIGAAMVINMFVAATAGTLVPLGLRAANIDPALASSVFITTLTDGADRLNELERAAMAAGTRATTAEVLVPDGTPFNVDGEVVTAGDTSVVVQTDADAIEIPYDQVVRGNLVYEQ